MATCINLHTEIKIDGEWHHYGNPSLGHPYRLFAKMAGVRIEDEDDITPIAEPRGLPGGASVITQMDADHSDEYSHSHSYLDASEIAELEIWFKEDHMKKNPDVLVFNPETYWGFLLGDSWGSFTKNKKERRKGLEDIRFVFWFDD
jgi:hypothetical protein